MFTCSDWFCFSFGSIRCFYHSLPLNMQHKQYLMKIISICHILLLLKKKWWLVTSNKLFIYVYISGCFMRYLENSNTVCIFCDSAAVDLENITVCTYSKHRELSSNSLLCTYNGKLHCDFFSLSLLFTVDYTVEKKNHTTVTTVIPKIGKISHLVVTVSVTVLQFCSCGHVSHHGLSVYEQEGQVWLPLFFWERC